MPKGIYTHKKGNKHSQETIEKMKISHTGHPTSKNTKEKIRKKLLNHPVSRTTKDKISIAHTGKKVSQTTKDKIGKAHHKGNKAKKGAKHKWIQKIYGKATICENREFEILNFECSQKSNKFHWSNKDHKYNREKKENWQQLCSSCHKKYDIINNKKHSNDETHTPKNYKMALPGPN